MIRRPRGAAGAAANQAQIATAVNDAGCTDSVDLAGIYFAVQASYEARLHDAMGLDAVQDDLPGVVHRALEPAHVSVWISRRD